MLFFVCLLSWFISSSVSIDTLLMWYFSRNSFLPMLNTWRNEPLVTHSLKVHWKKSFSWKKTKKHYFYLAVSSHNSIFFCCSPGGEEGYFTGMMLKKSRVKLLGTQIVPYTTTMMMRNLLIVQVALVPWRDISHLDASAIHSDILTLLCTWWRLWIFLFNEYPFIQQSQWVSEQDRMIQV